MNTPRELCVPSDPFSSLDVCPIIEEYKKRGGDVESLKQVVDLLSPKTSKGKRISRRAWDRTLQQCRESIDRVLALDDLHVRVRCSLKRVAKDLDVLLTPSLSETEREEIWSHHGRKSGRPRGATVWSLVPAILAEEFRKRFGRPRHGYILTLVRAAAPGNYPAGEDPESIDLIRKRIADVNKSYPGLAAREHDRLFP